MLKNLNLNRVNDLFRQVKKGNYITTYISVPKAFEVLTNVIQELEDKIKKLEEN